MQKRDGSVLYSASDLVNFLECEHLTHLDLTNLDTPLQRTKDSDQAKLIQAKGYAHEADYFRRLKADYPRVIDIAAAATSAEAKRLATLDAMRDGYDIIFQATLKEGCFIGHADFLRKVQRPSALGAWSYEVLDTKLARSTKAKFIIQLAYYSTMVATIQALEPLAMHVVLGDGTEASYRYADYARYLGMLRQRFIAHVQADRPPTYPVPCAKCDQCSWSGLCEQQRLDDDHLSQVANITRIQVKKLEASGVRTLAQLAQTADAARIPTMNPDTLARLRQQARLQFLARESGQRQLEILPDAGTTGRGFTRLPKPSAGDLFFDMEGDPLEEGGLEYLFGVYFFEQGKAEFKAFWAHSRAEEKRAFEAFLDFVSERLRRYPEAHIYHYAAYEQTALKKLMSLHGTRESDVDHLLRTNKLVDLYKVVRESIRVSEPRYSIKNIEHFYLQGRTGDVTNAGASIVFYERWKETGDDQLLKDIEAYNFDDVRSTYELREWLLGLRPGTLPWLNELQTSDGSTENGAGELTDKEKRLIPYRARLVDGLPSDRSLWGADEHLKELSFQLLDFHRRAAKPAWWALFARMEMSDDELLDDGECLAGLQPDPDHPPVKVNRSTLYTFRYPEQESKLKSGDSVTIAQTGETVRNLQVDEEQRRVSFTRTDKGEPLPFPIALGPGLPVSTDALIEAVFRFGDSIVEGAGRYRAIEAILTQQLPAIHGHPPGTPIIADSGELADIVEAIANLQESYIFVQGPPGAGKTYTGSHVIVGLLQRGYKVGVSSNSHKAIHNLVEGVEKVAKQHGVVFSGVKKASAGNVDSYFNGEFVADVDKNNDIFDGLAGPGAYQLVAGTAWLFADAKLDQRLDYLFVDEAGQVALANLVAMGTAAKNIVLLGDQMQLGQPTQGVHPGRSGESSLEYLLNGQATIPPERGIFLATTWRMHPDVCQFISDAVYDSRLVPEANNAKQKLVLNAQALPVLKPTGIRYLPADHDGCSQRSEEEAEQVLELVNNLLRQRYRDKSDIERPVSLNDILVVAPYNMQVNLLKKVLPEGARVGTVDKFQGQEAEVVIVSMATSSGDYLPRYIEFLYSKNRLNVAISRAKCLAIFIANPALMSIRCSTPEEMALVNTLCWVREVG